MLAAGSHDCLIIDVLAVGLVRPIQICVATRLSAIPCQSCDHADSCRHRQCMLLDGCHQEEDIRRPARLMFTVMCVQDTPFLSTMDPRELFATDQMDERVKLAHVHASCTVSLRQPRMHMQGVLSPEHSAHFCMYHWDHVNNTLRPFAP